MKELLCPACGCNDLLKRNAERSLKIPYGPDAVVKETYHKCNACDFEGDITGANDKVIEAALRKSEAISVQLMLNELDAQLITMRYFERALRLPVCVTDKWKKGEDLSPSTIALLRLIRTYPQLLEVADNNFVIEPTKDEV